MRECILGIALSVSLIFVLSLIAPSKASSPHHYFKSSDCAHWGPVEDIVLGSDGGARFKFIGQRCEDE